MGSLCWPDWLSSQGFSVGQFMGLLEGSGSIHNCIVPGFFSGYPKGLLGSFCWSQVCLESVF